MQYNSKRGEISVYACVRVFKTPGPPRRQPSFSITIFVIWDCCACTLQRENRVTIKTFEGCRIFVI